MDNNLVFNKILHLTGVGRNQGQLINIFELGGVCATPSKIKGWRALEGNKRYSPMPDKVLLAFFDGFFEYRDTLGEDGLVLFSLIKYKDETVD